MQSQEADIADALARNVADLTDREKRIAVALYQLLADGDPVSPQLLAERVGEPEDAISTTLDQWPGVFRDSQQRVIGFWGLAVDEMGHRFHAEGGKPMYTWCALDPFVVVPVIERPAKIGSNDPITGGSITMTVTPEGVRDLVPETTVVSLLEPEGPLGPDVIQTFCHYVLFFTSTDTARKWSGEQEHITIHPVAAAFDIGKRAWAPLRQHPLGTAEGPVPKDRP